MRTIFFFLWVTITTPAFGDDDIAPVKKHFKSDDYKVTFGTARAFDPNGELEIGYGNGHGFTLGWMRFRPRTEGVDVLCIELDEGRAQYDTKWPPDRAPITIKHARMKSLDYATFLHFLAVVNAAKLERIPRNSGWWSSNDFWLFARLTSNEKTLVDFNWAGHEGDKDSVHYAKPRAAVELARESVKGLDFKEHVLTQEDRGWASAKFARDWKVIKDREFSWWVRERYIITIGVIGDAKAIPTLREILGGDPKDRIVYHAINAITRLTKKDLRDKPVEEMDVEKVRRKVLESLRDNK
jgi:hypothetical protein